MNAHTSIKAGLNRNAETGWTGATLLSARNMKAVRGGDLAYPSTDSIQITYKSYDLSHDGKWKFRGKVGRTTAVFVSVEF